jgi:uncharacterized membrane protein YsdA (DUF1294 family)/cold shock CspA family protein/predicted RNA binding protein YcfA (HicA-like mRNA interferase family)
MRIIQLELSSKSHGSILDTSFRLEVRQAQGNQGLFGDRFLDTRFACYAPTVQLEHEDFSAIHCQPLPIAGMRHQGKITHWKDDQGFGFITPNRGGTQVFVHIKSFANRQRRPVGNEIVTYEIRTDSKGRPQAERVVFVGEREPSATPSGRGHVRLLLAAAFLGFVAWSVVNDQLPIAVFWLYLAASGVAFVSYALDKSAARNDRWRTRESTLHLFALVGGWPGALAAQKLLRHKSKKQSFQIVFWTTVAVNCGALGWLFSPSGAEALNSILRATHVPQRVSHLQFTHSDESGTATVSGKPDIIDVLLGTLGNVLKPAGRNK